MLWCLKEERKQTSKTILKNENDPEKQNIKLQVPMKKFNSVIERKSLTLDDLEAAESEIVHFSQSQHHGEEIKILQKGGQQPALQTRPNPSRWNTESWRKTS